MKKRVLITAILVLLLAAFSVHAYTEEEVAADDALPAIDQIQVYELSPHVNEISWWVSDNLELKRYEIYKNDVLIKTKAIGGIKQSSKFQDQQAWGVNNYRFVVYDVADHSVERNLTIDNTRLEDTLQETIANTAPIEKDTAPEEQTVITAETEPVAEASADLAAPAETPVQEQPAQGNGSGWFAAIIVLIVLAIFWKLLTLQSNKGKSANQIKYEAMGLPGYIHNKRNPKPKKMPKRRKTEDEEY